MIYGNAILNIFPFTYCHSSEIKYALLSELSVITLFVVNRKKYLHKNSKALCTQQIFPKGFCHRFCAVYFTMDLESAPCLLKQFLHGVHLETKSIGDVSIFLYPASEHHCTAGTLQPLRRKWATLK